jgi:hypothetical protein
MRGPALVAAALLAGCAPADGPQPALRDQRAAVVQVLQEVGGQLGVPLDRQATLDPLPCRLPGGGTGTRYSLTASAALPPGSGADAVRAVELLWADRRYLVGERHDGASTTLLALGTYDHALSFTVATPSTASTTAPGPTAASPAGAPQARLRVVAGCAESP